MKFDKKSNQTNSANSRFKSQIQLQANDIQARNLCSSISNVQVKGAKLLKLLEGPKILVVNTLCASITT